MKTNILITFALLSLASYAAPTTILECDDLGEGNIVEVKIFENEDGATQLEELHDDDKTKQRVVDDQEISENRYKLSSYYGYKRFLAKNAANSTWSVEWTCGESFIASCIEY